MLDSSKSFKIINRFVTQLPDSQLKIDLETVLQKKKPFQSFKYLIEGSDYRKTWFEFKQNKLEEIVLEEINR